MIECCNGRVNASNKTVEVKVREFALKMGHGSKHWDVLLCCISVLVRKRVLQGFAPYAVAKLLGIYVKVVHVKHCLDFSGIRQ